MFRRIREENARWKKYSYEHADEIQHKTDLATFRDVRIQMYNRMQDYLPSCCYSYLETYVDTEGILNPRLKITIEIFDWDTHEDSWIFTPPSRKTIQNHAESIATNIMYSRDMSQNNITAFYVNVILHYKD